MAFFAFKYGRIDWLESNNEYWLERDAALRTDFNIRSGFRTEDMPRIKYKSKMKEYYQKAGIATARYHMVDDLESCRKFIDEVGYPVVVKPDNGVGASDTHKLSSDEELKHFLLYKSTYHPDLATSWRSSSTPRSTATMPSLTAAATPSLRRATSARCPSWTSSTTTTTPFTISSRICPRIPAPPDVPPSRALA